MLPASLTNLAADERDHWVITQHLAAVRMSEKIRGGIIVSLTKSSRLERLSIIVVDFRVDILFLFDRFFLFVSLAECDQVLLLS